MASLQVGAKVNGTTNTPPRTGNQTAPNNSAVVSRAKMLALGLFIVLVVLHTQKGEE